MFQDSAGAAVVSAATQNVGMVIGDDLRGALGPNLAAVPVAGLAGYSTSAAANGSVVHDSGEILITSNGGSGYPYAAIVLATALNTLWRVRVSWKSNTSGAWIRKADNIGSGSGNIVTGVANSTNAAGSVEFYFAATATTSYVNLFAEQGDVGSLRFYDIHVEQVMGGNAFQGTSGSRPTLQTVSGRNVLRGDGTDDNLLTNVMPSAGAGEATIIVACKFNAVSDYAIGTSEGAGANAIAIQTDASGRLAGRCGTQDSGTIFGGADIRSIPGVAALRCDGNIVQLHWQPFGGERRIVYSGAQSGGPTLLVPYRYLSRNGNGTAFDFMDGDIYGVCAAPIAIPLNEMYGAMNFFANPRT